MTSQQIKKDSTTDTLKTLSRGRVCTRVYSNKAIQLGNTMATTLHKIHGAVMEYVPNEGVYITYQGQEGLVPIGNLQEIWFETDKP
jgi:hypothetical protein